MSQSEVARIRQQIDLQREAAIRGLHAPAIVANHQTITARMERMTVHLLALERAGLHKEAEIVCKSDDLWL
jgi:hypothetical protein